MSLQGGKSENADKSMNYNIGVVGGNEDHKVSANAFVNGYTDKKPDFMNPTGSNFKVAGGTLGYENSSGHAASLTAQHIPTFGNQVTAATKLNLIHTQDHKVDVNAFSTMNMPKAPIPNFATHGGGVEYQFREKLGASASMAHTPMFQQKDYSVNGMLNLHKTPTSSFDFNVGASKTTSPFSNGSWQPGASFTFQKKF